MTTLLCSLTDDRESSRLESSLFNVDETPCCVCEPNGEEVWGDCVST